MNILIGDCRETLRTLPADSVDCVVTSPPYYGLRNYNAGEAEVGREASLDDYLASLLAVFREVKRVLKPTGTVWLNIGDCYAGSGKGPSGSMKGQDHCPVFKTDAGLAAKQLMMVPNRMAIVLQYAGWFVRSEIIWAKNTALPEAVRDRPATRHEKIWLLTKSPRYYFDYEAGQLPAVDRGGRGDYVRKAGSKLAGFSDRDMHTPGKVDPKPQVRKASSKMATVPGRTTHSLHKAGAPEYESPVRRLRNYEDEANLTVWPMTPARFTDAHFATFPPELVERCLTVGCPPGGVVLDPFAGAGTTGLVAAKMGFEFILCELNAEYAEMARQRIEEGMK